MICLFNGKKFESRVSSVLSKNVKAHGKQFMFDNNAETCWNSDSGNLQWILISFQQEVDLSCIEIQFQGGFAGQKCNIEAGSDSKALKYIQEIFPEDTNSAQHFKLNQTIKAKVFKINFESSTDFFGRIIIYKLSFYS